VLFTFLLAIGALSIELERAALVITPLEELLSSRPTAYHVASIEVNIVYTALIGELSLVSMQYCRAGTAPAKEGTTPNVRWGWSQTSENVAWKRNEMVW
jgi:hypothetical protein